MFERPYIPIRLEHYLPTSDQRQYLVTDRDPVQYLASDRDSDPVQDLDLDLDQYQYPTFLFAWNITPLP